MEWYQKRFSELTTIELYQILKLRCDVFIVEQNCPYSDLDDLDCHPEAIHLFSISSGQITSYLRILPPNSSYPNMSSFGRVVTSTTTRGSGVGHQLVKRANDIIKQRWPDKTCHISAQAHLQRFYIQHGYQTVGEEYLEDDIPHIGMERHFSD